MYNKIINDFIKAYGKIKTIQLCADTSNLSVISLIFFIEQKLREKGYKTNIFIIRKNRIKTGLGKKIEGKISNGKIILIDNIINNYSNIYYIEKSLEIYDKKLYGVFAPIFNKNILNKEIIKKYNIKYFSIITNRSNEYLFENQEKIKYIGSFGETSRYNFNKISPLIYNNLIIIISDLGNIIALSSKNQKIEWEYKIKRNKNDILVLRGSPLIIGSNLLIGTCSGDLLKIDLNSGKLINKISLGDYIGISLSYSKKYKEIVLHISYSSINNNKSIVFIDKNTFKYKREILLENFISSNILIIDKLDMIIYSIENGYVTIMNSKTKEIIKKIPIEGIIKQGFTFYKKKNSIVFGTTKSRLYHIDLITGEILFNLQVGGYALYTKPLIVNDNIYVGSMDKKMYIISIKGKILGQMVTQGRIFSSPILIENKYIIFGSNDKRIYYYNYKINRLNYFQLGERFVTNISYDKHTGKILILDFRNNLYMINIF